MDDHPKSPKKPYAVPSFKVLDVTAAKAKLEPKTTSEDAQSQQMLAVIEKQLNQS